MDIVNFVKTARHRLNEKVHAKAEKKSLMAPSQEQEELNRIIEYLGDTQNEYIWAFNAGNSTKDFRGNPKYLFIYINYYRPDIKAYWICDDENTIALVRSLGFQGILSGTSAASYARDRTGVAVMEQVRGFVPFKNAKYLNLWHGNGFKIVERKRIEDGDDLRLELAAKYIKSNQVYQNQMILAAASENQERLLAEYIGVPSEHMLRVGYARCTYQRKYKQIKTFEHDLIGQRGLPEDTRIAVYAPTFRAKRGNSFTDAIRSFEQLKAQCEKNHILLVFKMHPAMENEAGFLNAKTAFQNEPYFLFWDNVNDIYEIMDRIDLLIYDYSSIFSDFVLGGVKHFLRYLYDRDQMIEMGCVISEEEYFSNSAGQICETFEELLSSFDNYEMIDDTKELDRIMARQWSYAGEDDFEKTIQGVLDFQIEHKEYPTLYSFDVFDTVLSRKGLEPVSIFYAMRERMQREGGYDEYFMTCFPELRRHAEKNAREYMRKSQDQRDSFHVEITLEQIYRRLQEVYPLTEEQVQQLMQWEQEIEIDSVIPLSEQIEQIKSYLAAGETVYLISDMYLPKDTIVKMLEKADPVLTTIPLFLSNEYGVLKTSRLLFFEVYRSFKPYYNFGKWIHCGDNINADQTQPRKLGIFTRHIDKTEYSEIEKDFTDKIATYDAFKLAAMQARMRSENTMARSEFVIDFVAPCFTAYVDWALRDAMSKGYETLYFVSRDGHPLKLIADALITEHQWPLKTKYIYASRRVWRIPSYFDDIDVDFWSSQGGNFNQITSQKKFLHAVDIDDKETFEQIFPQIKLDEIDFADWSGPVQPAKCLIPVLKSSETYKEYLLNRAEQEREIVCGYLKQEIDPTEKFAFVEFWGRGYNQLCHSRLWNSVVGEEVPTVYYYARTVHGTEGNCVRYNMTTNSTELFFLEAIFANMPYRSIENYYVEDGCIKPEIEPINYDRDLYEAMEHILPEFAYRYAKLDLNDPVALDRYTFDFCLDCYTEHRDMPFIYDNIGSLVDSVAMYGDKQEFARAYTHQDIQNIIDGEKRNKNTMSTLISYYRSTDEVQEKFRELFQLEKGEDPTHGKKCTPGQLQESRQYHQKYEEACELSKLTKNYYYEACQNTELKDKIVILSDNRHFNNDTLYSLKKQLAQQNRYEVRYCCTRSLGMTEKDLMKELASARYIITDHDPVHLSGVQLRDGTDCIRLLSSAFQLYGKGKHTYRQFVWRRRYEDLLFDVKYRHIQTPDNQIQKNQLMKAYDLPKSSVEYYDGCCITDVYFDPEYREKVRSRLAERYPIISNKKILYYMPSARQNLSNPRWLELLDLQQLKTLIGEEYVVFVDLRNQKNLLHSSTNKIEIPEFSVLIDEKKFNLRSLLCIADVVVGDYRDTFFETTLLDKPVYATAYDFEREMKSQNMLYDLDQMYPFPIVETARELAEALNHLETYDYGPIHQFRQMYLSGCDGESAKRLVHRIICNE